MLNDYEAKFCTHNTWKRKATSVILDVENPVYERHAPKQTNISTEAFGLSKKSNKGLHG